MNIDLIYKTILKDCKFIPKPEEWFIEGKEVCSDGAYNPYHKDDKFNDNFSLFRGYTNETYIGFTGELPREDGETCGFNEFYIYDRYGNEISEMTLEEYLKIRKILIEKVIY